MSELHVIIVMLTIVTVLYSDEQAFSWFLGRKQQLDEKKINLLHNLISVGLGIILLTGGVMFIDRANYLLGQPVFIVKMIFVGVLVLNAFFVGKVSKIAVQKPYMDLTDSEKYKVLISGAVSIVGWVGAGVCGLLLGG